MSSSVPVVSLADAVSTIRSGVHFRGSPPTTPNGEVRLIRLRYVEYESATIRWEDCPRVADENAPSQRLRKGDILLPRRGQNRVAFWIDTLPGPAIADAPFFVLQANPKHADPAFLAWQMNEPRAQHWLDRHAQGSGLSMLRQADLERLPLALPDRDTQQRLTDVHRLLRREQKLLRELHTQHERLARGLLHQYTTPNES